MIVTDFIQKLKANDIQLPIWVGQLLSFIPYSCRPIVGKVYRQRMKEISLYNNLSVAEKQAFIFKKMKAIVEYAENQIPFYKDYYKKKNFFSTQLSTFDDIKRIPVIEKSTLIDYDISLRSNESVPKFRVNTGGSSGITLSFYVQPSSIGNEWAHIHTMWAMLGYKPSDLKLYIAGRSCVKNGVDYEFARHTISLDMYKPFSETASLLKTKLKHCHCYYLHGYPSVLAEFAQYCIEDQELLDILKKSLKGAFLTSEYPYPFYRNKIETVFGIPSQSFYGHTERCVMAYETKEKFKFVPFQTYGYTEAIANGDGHFDLIGTSYYNQASPLIRYNTKDIIDNPVCQGEIMTSFNIFEGRSGQYILDEDMRKISLTGLIMGRHHELFDVCSHIQIAQNGNGKAIIYFVAKDGVKIDNPEQMFDGSNVKVQFSFEQIDMPIRTVSGKVNLLVNKQ